MVKKGRERSDRKAENKKRPDVDKFHVTVLRRSFVNVCVKISYLGSLSLFLSLNIFSLFLEREKYIHTYSDIDIEREREEWLAQ